MTRNNLINVTKRNWEYNTYSMFFNVSTILETHCPPSLLRFDGPGDTKNGIRETDPLPTKKIFFYESFKDYSREPFSLIRRNF